MTGKDTRRCRDCGAGVGDFSPADHCTNHDGMGYRPLFDANPGEDDDGEPGSWCLAA